jgi:hypothetical protein
VFPHGDIGAEGANWLAAAAPDQPPAGEPSATVAAPASYIERFTHLFADDADDVPPTAEPRLSQPLPETVTPKPRSMRVAPPENTHSPGSGEADEESIEQYMAKLLQRVRGDTDRPPASQAPPPPIRPERPAAHAGMPLSAPGNSSSRLLSRADSPDSFVPAEAAVTEVRTELRLRAPAPERLADLKALRQLSNETARQAIGVYETRYQRRRTLSRIIVSALAGATGLWLICLAPSWRDPQLISACVLLYIAAHWMTQTLRSNIRLLRARSIEFVTGQSHGDGRPEQLPIDIEDDRR